MFLSRGVEHGEKPPFLGEWLFTTNNSPPKFEDSTTECPYCSEWMVRSMATYDGQVGRVVEIYDGPDVLVDDVPAGTVLYRCKPCKQVFCSPPEARCI